MSCLNVFEPFKSMSIYGGSPEFTATLEADTLNIYLEFPLTINDNDKITNLESFSYTLPLQNSLQLEDGEVSSQKILKSPDGKASLSFNAGTKVTAPGSIPTKEITLALISKNAGGMSNGVVVGGTLFQGGPNGARFDPPLDMEVKLDDHDLVGIDPSTLRISYFDTEKGFWVAYPSEYDAETRSIKGKIDHFTNISVTVCAVAAGSTQTAEELSNYVIIPIDAVVDPFGEEFCGSENWNFTHLGDGYITYKQNEENGPICDYRADPEQQARFFGNLELAASKPWTSQSWNESELAELEQCHNDEINVDRFKDWDQDDQVVNTVQWFIKYNNGTHDKVFSLNSGGTATDDQRCLAKCMEGVTVLEPKSKDGLKDDAIINCTYSFGSKPSGYLEGNADFDVSTANPSPFFCGSPLSEKLATPKVFGFTIEDLEALGSAAEADALPRVETTFEIKKNGDACIDGYPMANLIMSHNAASNRTLLSNFGSGSTAVVSATGVAGAGSYGNLISSNWGCSDNCEFKLAADLQAGDNTLITVVKNNLGLGDMCMFGRAYLEIRGAGIRIVQGNGLYSGVIMADENQCKVLGGCWDAGGPTNGFPENQHCILPGNSVNGYCCNVPYEGGEAWLEYGACRNPVVEPKTEAECDLKKGCWYEGLCYPFLYRTMNTLYCEGGEWVHHDPILEINETDLCPEESLCKLAISMCENGVDYNHVCDHTTRVCCQPSLPYCENQGAAFECMDETEEALEGKIPYVNQVDENNVAPLYYCPPGKVCTGPSTCYAPDVCQDDCGTDEYSILGKCPDNKVCCAKVTAKTGFSCEPLFTKDSTDFFALTDLSGSKLCSGRCDEYNGCSNLVSDVDCGNYQPELLALQLKCDGTTNRLVDVVADDYPFTCHKDFDPQNKAQWWEKTRSGGIGIITYCKTGCTDLNGCESPIDCSAEPNFNRDGNAGIPVYCSDGTLMNTELSTRDSLLKCGDGMIEADEVCDDGNTASGDGCRGDCLKVEDGWKCGTEGCCLKYPINSTDADIGFQGYVRHYFKSSPGSTVSGITERKYDYCTIEEGKNILHEQRCDVAKGTWSIKRDTSTEKLYVCATCVDGMGYNCDAK
jgi:cysteine-rich repeat protein